MRVVRALLVLCVFLTGAGPAAKDAREAKVTEVTLDNGLRVLLLENKTSPLVSVWAWYRVGSRHERPGQTGVSHFVEHLNFKGTEEIPRDEMTAAIDRRGGTWNGYTWLDQTAYFGTVAKDALPDLLRIEAQRMTKSTFAEADIASERNVVLAELAGDENSPPELLDQEVVSAAIKAHPYHWPTIGWAADLKNLTREDLLAHYRTWYRPDNATLVLVGDFRTADALALVKERFESVPRGPPVTEPFTAEPPQQGERRVTLSRPGSTRYLQVSYHSPAIGDADFAAMLVADAMLGGAKGTNLWTLSPEPATRTSRLHAKVIAPGLGTFASTSLAPTADPFVHSIRVTVSDTADADAVEAAAIGAAESLAREATAKDLERAKAGLEARLVFEASSVTDVAHQLGMFDILDRQSGVGWRRLYRLPGQVREVTLADVKRVAAKYWVPNSRTVGWFAPTTSGGKSGVSLPAQLPSRYRAKAPRAGAAAAAKLPATPVGPAITRTVLPNGLVVLAARNALAPEVVVRVDVRAGSLWEPADKAGLATLAASLLPAGGGTRAEMDVADAFDSVGALLDVHVDTERATVSTRMLSTNVAALLPVIEDIVVTPTFPREAFERERAAAIAAARERGDDTRAVAEATMRAALYAATDARGRHPGGAVASLVQITRADLAEFHLKTWRPDTTVITVSGDIDPAEAVRLVKKSFGTWRASGAKPQPIAPGTSASAQPGWMGRIELPGKSQTDVVLGWPGPARSDPQWLAVKAANTILGEMGLGGRLGRVLREDRGIAYYAWGTLESGIQPGPFVVRTGVPPAKVDEAIRACRDEITRFLRDGMTADELAAAKTLLVGELGHRFETNEATAAYLADLEHFGLGVEHPKRYAGLVQALTLEQVNEAARTWIKADAIAVTAGPASK